MENVKECNWVDLGSNGCPECRDRMVEERSGECDYCGSYWFPWEQEEDKD